MAGGKVARLFVVTLLVAGSRASAAWAEGPPPDKMACIAADTDGQALRLGGNLTQARKRLAICAAASCPGIVRDDCLQRIAEVEVAQPTVVFTATNGDGRPLVAVRVSVDGARIAERLDGRPLPVDPGDHVFVFEAVGRVSADMRLTLHEGEKKVRHAVVLRTGSGAPADQVPGPKPVATSPHEDDVADLPVLAPIAAPPPVAMGGPAPVQETAPAPAAPAPEDARSKRRIAAIAAGGAGVVGVAVGSIFGVMTVSKWNDAKAQCGSGCPAASPSRQEESTAHAEGNVSTVAFIVGGIGFAASAWLWFTGPSKSPERVSVLPVASPSQGQLLIRGQF